MGSAFCFSMLRGQALIHLWENHPQAQLSSSNEPQALSNGALC